MSASLLHGELIGGKTIIDPNEAWSWPISLFNNKLTSIYIEAFLWKLLRAPLWPLRTLTLLLWKPLLVDPFHGIPFNCTVSLTVAWWTLNSLFPHQSTWLTPLFPSSNNTGSLSHWSETPHSTFTLNLLLILQFVISPPQRTISVNLGKSIIFFIFMFYYLWKRINMYDIFNVYEIYMICYI